MKNKILAFLISVLLCIVGATVFIGCNNDAGTGSSTFEDAPGTEGLVYELNADTASYSVTGIGTATGNNIVIAAKYENKPVTGIAEKAFDYNSFESITIPSTIKTIGNSAFEYCGALSQINFNATEMNDLPQGNRIFYKSGKDSTGITVTIGANVKRIPARLFYSELYNNTTNITSVVFSAGSVLESVGADAFNRCENLNSVYISDIKAWCNISFSDYYGNPLYLAENLYLNNELVVNLEIPNTVTEIKPYVFFGCRSLESLIISNGVERIGRNAFVNCSGLTNVTIPNSVTSIDVYAFSGCGSLSSVTFSDTQGWTAGTTAIDATDLANVATAASYLNSTYMDCAWIKE